MVEEIKISIITINYNNLEGLKNTFNSVVNQTYKEIEFIVIDGNSDDGSVDFIRNNSKYIDKKLIENDQGIYDAMNKGLDLSSGQFCLFLNSGDYFIESFSLRNIMNQVNDNDCVYFSIAKVCNKNVSWYMPPKEVNIDKWLTKTSPNHQTILFPKKFYLRNRFDLFFQIVGDVDFIERAKIDYNFRFIPITTIVFDLGGISNNTSSFNRIKRQILESIIVHLKYFPNKILNLFYVPFKFIFKYLLGKIATRKYDKLLKFINRIK